MWFQELKLIVGSEKVDELADAFLEAGALSVGIEDAYANTTEEQALFDEPDEVAAKPIQIWDKSLVLCLFAETSDVPKIVSKVLRDLCIVAKEYTLDKVENQDWVRLTQSQFEPIVISERLWIVPSWHEAPSNVPYVVELDPGLAFGTGSHPTTRLCLTWLDENIGSGQSVLDYGCGSGILAITAKKLGAMKVLGVDLDEQAIISSRTNAENNRVAIDFLLPDDFKEKVKFDVVVANILANPLRILASLLAEYVKSQGKIVLSGILQHQQQEIMAIYQPWFTMQLYAEQEGWVCLVGVRH